MACTAWVSLDAMQMRIGDDVRQLHMWGAWWHRASLDGGDAKRIDRACNVKPNVFTAAPCHAQRPSRVEITPAFNNSTAAPIGQDLAAFLLGMPTGGEFDLNAAQTGQAGYYAFFLQD